MKKQLNDVLRTREKKQNFSFWYQPLLKHFRTIVCVSVRNDLSFDSRHCDEWTSSYSHLLLMDVWYVWHFTSFRQCSSCKMYSKFMIHCHFKCWQFTWIRNVSHINWLHYSLIVSVSFHSTNWSFLVLVFTFDAMTIDHIVQIQQEIFSCDV